MPWSATAQPLGEGCTGGWLVRSGEVLASLVAPPAGRVVGSVPAPAAVIEKAVVIRAGRSGSGLDVAWCRPALSAAGAAGDMVGGDMVVRRVRSLRRGWVVLIRPRSGSVVVAEGGAFERWALRVGDRLAVRCR